MKKFLILLSLIVSFSSFAGTKQDAEDANKRKDYATALKLWMELAENNDAEAQFRVAYFYDFGIGVEKNSEKAFFWYLKSANNGESTAQLNIGNMYYNGIGVSKDLKQSAIWYKKAADNGDDDAQYNYAKQLHMGEGVKKDTAKAYPYFKKAALNGNYSAQHVVGLYLTDFDLFESAWKTEKKSFIDTSIIGLRWLRLASESGHKGATERINYLNSNDEAKLKLADAVTSKLKLDDRFARPGIYKQQQYQPTKYGDIGIYNEATKSSFVFKRDTSKPIIQANNLLKIDSVVEIKNKIYVLVMVDNAEKNCFGNFRWVTITGDEVKTTDTFGNCSGIADLSIKDGNMHLTMPKYKYAEKATFTFGG